MRTRVMDESQRAYGFTTLQMKAAPQGALYIWPVSGSVDYARDLARHLGRDDLEIVSGSILDRRGERLRGRKLSGIVLDHAAEPDDAEMALLMELRTFVCRAPADSWKGIDPTKLRRDELDDITEADKAFCARQTPYK